MHSSLVWVGCTNITADVLISRTGVSFEDRDIRVDIFNGAW